jgi:hypothetical protein
MHTVKAEWFNNRRLEEIYKHAEFKLPETQQVLGTVQSINFELTRQPANELMAICDMASGMTDPNNPMMDAEYLAGWIDNHRSEVLDAIEAGMFHMDDVVNVLSSKYDVGLMRGPEIDLDNTGFDDRDDRS